MRHADLQFAGRQLAREERCTLEEALERIEARERTDEGDPERMTKFEDWIEGLLSRCSSRAGLAVRCIELYIGTGKTAAEARALAEPLLDAELETRIEELQDRLRQLCPPPTI